MTIHELVKPFKDRALCTPETHLWTAARLVQTTYEPLFVFDDDAFSKFRCIVSLVDALFRRQAPGHAQIAHYCESPPDIHRQSSIFEVARHMASLKLYTLPLIEHEAIIGMIEARDILKKIRTDHSLYSDLLARLSPEPLPVISRDAFIKDAYTHLRNSETPDLAIVDAEGILVGIASRFDIESALLQPTSRQRFRSTGEPYTNETFAPQKLPQRILMPLDRFYNRVVSFEQESATHHISHTELIDNLLSSPYTSIFIIDGGGKPREYLAYQTLLETISHLEQPMNTPLIIHDQRDHYSAIEKDRIEEILSEFSTKYREQIGVTRLSISFEESKTMANTIRAIGITLKAELRSGEICIVRAEKRNALGAVREGMKELAHQFRKLHDRRMNH